MSLSKACDLLIILSLIVLSSARSPHIAKRGCSDRCGNVMIPFPFGIGADCAVNEWYVIKCVNSSTPYLSAAELNQLEVVGVDLVNQTVTVNTPTSISDCKNVSSSSSSRHQIKSVDLHKTPFRFSGYQNKLVVEGCGNAVISSHNGTVLSGCSTICRNDSSSTSSALSTTRRVEINNNKCLGITCCETRIPNNPATSSSYQDTTNPYDLTSYIVEMETDDDRSSGLCGSAFFVDENLYAEGRFSNGVNVPVSLVWTLTLLDFKKITCCDLNYYGVYSTRVLLANGTFEYVRTCSQSPDLVGNMYVRDGCAVKKECANCRARKDYCLYSLNLNFTCQRHDPAEYGYRYPPSKKLSLGVILGVSISMGIVILVICSYALYKLIKKTKDKRRRKRVFKRNGGLLLKQQQEAQPSLIEKPYFSHHVS